MKSILPVISKYILILALLGSSHLLMAQPGSLQPDDWKLGVQAYTFRLFTFSEALDKADSCGLKFIEGYPGQKIGGDLEGKMDFNMDEATREKILGMLRSKGIQMLSFGVVTPKTDSAWVQLFKFAKAMGLQNIVSEPKEEDIPLLSKLCDEYEINVAIHNHPSPSHYWNPDIVLAAIKDASPRVGVCADIGHWLRSGLDPVESLKKLEGHVIEFHMKDLNEKGVREAHDLPWGTGISNLPAVMQEMKRQNFKGVIAIEYEYNWENSVPEVKASAEFFQNEKEKILK